MPLTAWKDEERNSHKKQMNIFTKTSGGCVIAVRDNAFIDSKQNSLEPTYLVVTILKALMLTCSDTFLSIDIFSDWHIR